MADQRADFDAIIFDCDGVLVDSEIVGLHETAAFLKGHGFAWSGEDLVREFTGMHVDSLTAKFREQYAEILGRAPSDVEMETLLEGFINERRKQRHTMTVVPGTVEMAQQVTALQIAVGVASSSQTHFLEDKMKRYDLWDMFAPHIYSADRVHAGKPDPAIFLYTAEQMGHAPERCLVIEDSTHGVTAGIKAGMTVWGFTGGGHCFEGHGERLTGAGAARVVKDHESLMSHLAVLVS